MPRPNALVLLTAPLMLAACDSGGTPSGAVGSPTPAGAGGSTASPAPAATSPNSPIARGEQGSTTAPTQDASDACRASAVRDPWLNALPSDEVKAAIADAVGERRIRYYTEGDAITMDYSEERLNVVLGEDGRIKEFRCG